MIPTQYNLPDAYRGDTYGPIQFVFTDGNGNPIDLSQSVAISQVRNYKNALVLQWSSLDGTMSISGNTLTFNTIPGEKMKIPAGTMNYDLQINFSGVYDTFINGTWNVIQDVTDV